MPFMTKKMGNTGIGDADGVAESRQIIRTLNMNMGVLRQDMEAMPDEIIRRIPPYPEYPAVEIPPFPEIPPYPEIPPFPDIPDYSAMLEVLESKIDSLLYQPKDNRVLEKILIAFNILLLILVSLLSFGVLP